MTHTFTTARLTLRPARSDDSEALLAMATRPLTPENTPDRLARTRALVSDSLGWFDAHGFGLWVLQQPPEPRLLGYFGVRPRESRSAPELMWGLVPDRRGQGLITEAGCAVVARLFADTEIMAVWAAADPTNEKSVAVMLRLGMTLDFAGDFDGRPSVIYRLRAARTLEARR